jgi:hypothetical protein
MLILNPLKKFLKDALKKVNKIWWQDATLFVYFHI